MNSRRMKWKLHFLSVALSVSIYIYIYIHIIRFIEGLESHI